MFECGQGGERGLKGSVSLLLNECSNSSSRQTIKSFSQEIQANSQTVTEVPWVCCVSKKPTETKKSISRVEPLAWCCYWRWPDKALVAPTSLPGPLFILAGAYNCLNLLQTWWIACVASLSWEIFVQFKEMISHHTNAMLPLPSSYCTLWGREAFSAGQFTLETNTGWQGFKKRAGRPLSHVTVLFKTYSSFSHPLPRPSGPGCSRLQIRPYTKNINSWRPRCWNRSQPHIWVNSCEGQCLPMCNKAAQTLLQHPASVGFVIWGGGSRYLGMCIQPEESGSVLFPFIQKMNNKKVQLVNTEGMAKVTYSHTSLLFWEMLIESPPNKK